MSVKQAPQIDTHYFMGQGMLFIAPRDKTTGLGVGFRHVGNCPDLKIDLKTTVVDAKEAMTGARALAKRMTTEQGADFSAQLESINRENLALALRAAITVKTAGTVTDEAVLGYKGALLPLKYIGLVDDSSLTVKSSDGTTTYVKGTDYLVNRDSLTILAAGAIGTADTTGAGVALKICYGYGAQTIIDAFTEPAAEYVLRFEGLNTADSNNAVVVEIFRVQPDALKSLALIQDKQAIIDLTGACLIDSTRTTGSKFFRVVQAD